MEGFVPGGQPLTEGDDEYESFFHTLNNNGSSSALVYEAEMAKRMRERIEGQARMSHEVREWQVEGASTLRVTSATLAREREWKRWKRWELKRQRAGSCRRRRRRQRRRRDAEG